MFLEWWMLAVIGVAAGLWAEYRARESYRSGRLDAIDQYQAQIDEAMQHDFRREREMGAASCLVNLIKMGMITFDESGAMIGAGNKKLTLTDAETYFKLQQELKKENNSAS